MRRTMDNLSRTKENREFKVCLLMGLGWLLVVLGVLGLFLPFLQGILFITLGSAFPGKSKGGTLVEESKRENQQAARDDNISFKRMVDLVGETRALQMRDLSLALYRKGLEVAEPKGIIIADTKFEFGVLDGKLILIDELMTPDSSRFWPKDQYKPGRSQPSFDKRYLRDYLEGLYWGKTYPPQRLPQKIIEQTARRYRQAMELLMS